MMRFFNLSTSQDLFYRVGLGTIDNQKLKEFAAAYNNTLINFFKKRMRGSDENPNLQQKDITTKYDLLVFGKERQKLEHSYANCCNPIPGDDVFGFVTVSEGIKVHKTECPNALSLQSSFSYRIISCKWMDSSAEDYNVKLSLTGIDKIGLVNEVTRLISNNMHVNINKINFDSEDGFFTGLIHVGVKNKTILEKLIKNLSKVNGIDKITRK